MRHNKKFNHLGRTSSHRNAMLSNMCVSLITHKRIFTTVAKAKALKKVIEPIITKSKDDTTHSRRLVFQALKINAAAPMDNRKIKIQKEEHTRKKDVITELFQVVSQKVGDRPGGYTRIIKTGNRLGDNAEMCFIELVDFNDNMMKETKTETKGRTRRAGSKKTTTTEVAEAVEAPKKRTSKKAVEAAKDAPATDAPATEAKTEE